MFALTRHKVKASSTVLISLIIVSTLAVSFAIFDSFYLKSPVIQSILSPLQRIDAQTCEMSWSRPSYIEIQDKPDSPFSEKYTLYLYREGYLDSDQLQGIPALFIPGQAGSYKQVRSLAAETATYYYDNNEQHHNITRSLDYFTVDLNEELSALSGQIMLDQAEYMNAVIQCILQLYKNSPQNPSSVLIVGHSMGGLVARTMIMSSSYVPGTINTIVTLASPHLKAPLVLDPLIYKTYNRLTKFWTPDQFDKEALLKDVSIVSITGGYLDTIVDSNGANLDSLVPETHGFAVISSSIPFVWTGCDHMAILWCNQIVKVVAKSLVEITDISTSAQTKPLSDRIEIFKHYLVGGMKPNSKNHLNSIKNLKKKQLLLGSTINYKLDEPTKPSIVLIEQVDSTDFIMNIPVNLENRWSIVVCNGPNPGEADCKPATISTTILPSATAEKPIMADPYRLITVKYTHGEGKRYIGIIDRGGPAVTSGFIVSDNRKTEQIFYDISFWDILTGSTKFNVSGYYSQHVLKNKMSTLLFYNLLIAEMETKETRFMPFIKLTVPPYDSQYYRKLELGTSNRISFHKTTASEELVLNFFTDNQYLQLTLQVDWYGTLGRLVLGFGGIILPFLYSNVLIVVLSQLYTYLMNGKSNYVLFNDALIYCLKGPFPLVLILLIIASTLQITWNQIGLSDNNMLTSILQQNMLFGSDDIMLPAAVVFLYFLSIGFLSIIWLVVSFLMYIINIPLKQFGGSRVKSQRKSWRLFSVHSAIIAAVIRFIPTPIIFTCYYIAWLFMTASTRTKSDLPAIQNIYSFRQSWLIFLTSLLPYYLPGLIVCVKDIILGWTKFSVSIEELVQDIPIIYLLAFLVTTAKSPDVFQLRWIKPIIILLNCVILYQIIFGFTRPFLLSPLI